MADGDFGTVIDFLEWDTDTGSIPSICHVSGDIFAIAYQGTDWLGKLVTVSIDSAGDITAVATYTFDDASGSFPHLVHISGTTFAIAYKGPGSDGWLKTIAIEDNGTTIRELAFWEFDDANGLYPRLLHISGDVYAIAYQGADYDGFVKTLTIGADGTIGALESREFLTTDVYDIDFIHVSGTTYAIAYRSVLSHGFVVTLDIQDNGTIGESTLSSLEFETVSCETLSIVYVGGTTYAIAYKGVDSDGFLVTLDIQDNGTIGEHTISSLEFDTTNCAAPQIIALGYNFFVISYSGSGSDGYSKSYPIQNDGTIGDMQGSLEWDIEGANTPDLLQVAGDTYAVAYTGPDGDGWLKTFSIETPGAKLAGGSMAAKMLAAGLL